MLIREAIVRNLEGRVEQLFAGMVLVDDRADQERVDAAVAFEHAKAGCFGVVQIEFVEPLTE